MYFSIRNLKMEFHWGGSILVSNGAPVKAVNNVSLDIYKGKTLGLVGESGCGKSTLGKCILRLTEPNSGKVIYNGIDLLKKEFFIFLVICL